MMEIEIIKEAIQIIEFELKELIPDLSCIKEQSRLIRENITSINTHALNKVKNQI